MSIIPLFKVPVYSATKALFRSFTLLLRHQLLDSGIEVIEVVPLKLNTNLDGIGLHDDAPQVNDFIESIFEQLKNGSNELSFGSSAEGTRINKETIQAYFNMLKPLSS